MTIEAILARGFQLMLALTGAYTLALWFALIVWAFRDIESRSRSVIAQIFSTLLVVLFFVPGALIYLLLRPRETLDEAFGRALEEEYLLQDLEDLSLCQTCHHPVQADFIVCPHCYTELRRTCPSCERLVDVDWAICAFCTAELVTAQEPVSEPPKVERPSLLPLPLRLLRERTEVRLERSLDLVAPEQAPQLPEGERATNGAVIARETHATGEWGDDTGKRAWSLSRVREVFRPVPPDGEHYENGHRADDDEVTQPVRWATAALNQPRGAEEAEAAPNGTLTPPHTPTRELFSYGPPKQKTPPDQD